MFRDQPDDVLKLPFNNFASMRFGTFQKNERPKIRDLPPMG